MDGEGGKKISAFTIVEAGIKLSLNEETIATACVYYHTFHSDGSTSDINTDEELLVMATLSLASKVREQITKISDIVNTCYRCMNPDRPPLDVGDLYWHLKESVAKYELLLLRALKFNMYWELPHPFLCHFLLALARWVDLEAWERSQVARVSWALLQDCYLSDLCLQEPAHVLATSVLYLAMHCCRLQVPCSEHAQKLWWQALCPGVSESKLQEVSVCIMQFVDAANGNKAKT